MESLPSLQPTIRAVFELIKFESVGLQVEVLFEQDQRGESTHLCETPKDRTLSESIPPSCLFLVERWRFSLSNTRFFSAEDASDSLTTVYKHLIILFRSLQTYCDWLPSAAMQHEVAPVWHLLHCQISTLQTMNGSLDGGNDLQDDGQGVISHRFDNVESLFGTFNMEVVHQTRLQYTKKDSSGAMQSLEKPMSLDSLCTVNENLKVNDSSRTFAPVSEGENTDLDFLYDRAAARDPQISQAFGTKRSFHNETENALIGRDFRSRRGSELGTADDLGSFEINSLVQLKQSDKAVMDDQAIQYIGKIESDEPVDKTAINRVPTNRHRRRRSSSRLKDLLSHREE